MKLISKSEILIILLITLILVSLTLITSKKSVKVLRSKFGEKAKILAAENICCFYVPDKDNGSINAKFMLKKLCAVWYVKHYFSLKPESECNLKLTFTSEAREKIMKKINNVDKQGYRYLTNPKK